MRPVDAVEALAANVYQWRRHWNDPDAYWVVGRQAAAMLAVSGARLRQLADQDRAPYFTHREAPG
jgi:hypothetical protein